MMSVIGESSASEEICQWRSEFKEKAWEQRYLESKLQQDKKVARFLAIAVATVLLLILPFDKLIIKPQHWPHPAFEWRVVIVVVCIVSAYSVIHQKTSKQLKKLVLAFIIFFLFNVQAIALTYQDHYVLHVFFDVIIIVIIYSSTLLSLKLSSLLCVSYAVIGSLNIVFTKTLDTHTVGMVLVAYLSANLVGTIISQLEHRLRRELFLRKEQLKEAALKMESFAFRDALTNIPNRRSFDDSFEHHQKSAKRLAAEHRNVCLIISDIDFFKKVNDTYGHDVGDIVLVKFSQFLAESIRPNDAVYRFGGEEFIMILQNIKAHEATEKIRNIIKKLNDRVFTVPEINYPITASFGLAFLKPEENSRDIIARADKMLYQAKANGRNQLCIDTTGTF
ncbi:GGDEF domain-containing protein [Pseudoalteromonas piscicida]|uniref:diguanylate cyclase n=1 Tax=Pseudoalteromonas piscicida TaxID=43662 RepID=A0AAD0RME9_PSEO7|nr:GGDEF domain-containing protein [Pseudoalteromonas piscicida]ASD69740.1 hypothetical protein B1L02_23140 [Pseudoalteromonas piscicida]AXR04764.1 GGDEF domain-containing protein [Pseudoalteromonas piscicida]